jgi:hypothetical protein
MKKSKLSRQTIDEAFVEKCSQFDTSVIRL